MKTEKESVDFFGGQYFCGNLCYGNKSCDFAERRNFCYLGGKYETIWR